MRTKRNKIFFSIFLSLFLCLETLNAGAFCSFEDGNCLIKVLVPAQGQCCTEAADKGDAEPIRKAVQLPGKCCDIQTCHPEKSRNTGVPQFGRHIQQLDIGVAPCLVYVNQCRLNPGVSQAAHHSSVKLYTLIQSLLC